MTSLQWQWPISLCSKTAGKLQQTQKTYLVNIMEDKMCCEKVRDAVQVCLSALFRHGDGDGVALKMPSVPKYFDIFTLLRKYL